MTALPQIAGVHSAAQSYAGLVLSMKPLGFWPLDEANGSVARDISGNGFDGTYVATPTLHGREARPPHQLGDARATDFNGTTQYVDLDAHVASFGNLAAFTMVAQFTWTGSAGFDTVCGLADSSQVIDYWRFTVDAQRAVWTVADGGNIIYTRVTSTLTSGARNFLAAAADGSGNDARFNGAAIPYIAGNANTAAGTDQVADLDNMRIANRERSAGNTDFWDGPVWNVAFFDSRLSTSQLNALYLASLYGT